MKLKNSGSISDSEQLNIFEEDSDKIKLSPETQGLVKKPLAETEKLSPFTEVVTIFTTSPPPASAKEQDPASHDKIYYDDRFNESIFDPFLATSCLPKILISIAGMLLTGFFLNIIIVSARALKNKNFITNIFIF